jgi:hypothetical protein
MDLHRRRYAHPSVAHDIALSHQPNYRRSIARSESAAGSIACRNERELRPANPTGNEKSLDE